jgi:hypothetical protein
MKPVLAALSGRWRTPALATCLGLILGTPASLLADVYVRVAPPKVIVENPGPARPGYYWDPGHWRWNGARYVWVPGHYVAVPHERAHWVPGHWVERPRGWVWVEGHWVY